MNKRTPHAPSHLKKKTFQYISKKKWMGPFVPPPLQDVCQRMRQNTGLLTRQFPPPYEQFFETVQDFQRRYFSTDFVEFQLLHWKGETYFFLFRPSSFLEPKQDFFQLQDTSPDVVFFLRCRHIPRQDSQRVHTNLLQHGHVNGIKNPFFFQMHFWKLKSWPRVTQFGAFENPYNWTRLQKCFLSPQCKTYTILYGLILFAWSSPV